MNKQAAINTLMTWATMLGFFAYLACVALLIIHFSVWFAVGYLPILAGMVLITYLKEKDDLEEEANNEN